MSALGFAVAGLLLAIALLHVAWAFGATWPARDQAALVRAVIGARGMEQRGRAGLPPPRTTLLVALALAAAAAWAAMLGLVAPPLPSWLLSAGGLALAAVFLLRGAFGYTAAWRRRHPGQPFASLDRLLYSPLCLGIGLALLLLVSVLARQ